MPSRSIVTVTLIVSVATAVAAGIASYDATRVLARASDALLHTKEATLAVERTLSLVRDAETGQRGFLLTGREAYLEPYARALAEIDKQFVHLETLLVDDDAARADLTALSGLITAKTGELARTIVLAKGGTRDAAIAVVLTDEGQLAMRSIRELVARMELREQQQLAVQRLEWLEATATAGRSTAALTLLAVVLLGVLTGVSRRDSARIRASERRLAVTMRSIGDGVIVTDAQGAITMLNGVAEDLTGWTAQEAEGKPLDLVFRIVHEESRQPAENPVTRVLREGRIVGLATHTALLRKDGTERPISDSAAPVFDAERSLIGVVLVFRDATAQRDTERVLRDADRKKDEFLAILAHELRNPLAPIRQAAQIARFTGTTEEQRRWTLDVIDRQVGHMARLLDDLLDVARITRGTLEIRRSRVQLSSVVQDALEMARPLLDAHRHTLDIISPSQDLVLDADPLRLAQVIGNLLTNAAKYTPPAGHIRLSVRRDGDFAVVQVADNGIGLSEDALGKVFDMFVQIDPPFDRAEPGLGIGLALTKGLIALHHGDIEARSAGPGLGSEFIVRLPLASIAHVPAMPPHKAEPRPSISLRVLVADDNRDAADSLALLLKMQGHHVNVAYDGEQALRSLESETPDIALLDIGMPKLSGYEVAERIRAQDGASGIALVAITGWGQTPDEQRARAAGFDHHLIKPVEVDTVLDLVAHSARAVDDSHANLGAST